MIIKIIKNKLRYRLFTLGSSDTLTTSLQKNKVNGWMSITTAQWVPNVICQWSHIFFTHAIKYVYHIFTLTTTQLVTSHNPFLLVILQFSDHHRHLLHTALYICVSHPYFGITQSRSSHVPWSLKQWIQHHNIYKHSIFRKQTCLTWKEGDIW